MSWLRRVFSFNEGTSKPTARRVSRTRTDSPVSDGPFGIGRSEWLQDEGAFLGDYYAYLRRKIPAIGNGIGVYRDLASSGITVGYEGGTDAQQSEAVGILDSLDNRVYEYDFCGGNGFESLTSLFYTTLYTFGRVCFEMVPYQDLSGVAYVAYVDPFSVRMRRVGNRVYLYQRQAGGGWRRMPSARMFYAAFDPDGKRPEGISLLDSIEWVVEVKEKMIEDMAKGSHNAGHPRLHVAVGEPEVIPGEGPADYTSRANADFDEVESLFRDLDVDENPITWSNVKITSVGTGQNQGFQWAIQLDRVNDEVIAGLRLYSWVLGFSASVTKNWVDAQHTLLMQRIAPGVSHGSHFRNWVKNSDLRMKGSPVRVTETYKPMDSPGVLIQERARKFEYDRNRQAWKDGIISKDQFARQIGYRSAYRQDSPKAKGRSR